MMQTCGGGARRRGISVRALGIVTVMVACALGAGMVGAQAASRNGKEANAGAKADAHGPRSYETLYLNGAMSDSNARDVVTDLRNLLQRARVYYVAPQRAVSIYGTAEEIALAKQVIEDVGRPVRSYKVTYTLTETGGGQAAKTRHISMLVASGGTAEVKQGTRVPIMTGSNDPGGKTDTEFQYIDLGLAIRAKLSGGQNHLALDSLVEESRVAGAQTIEGVQEPVIQQTRLTGTSTLAEGKTVSLGSLEIPASGGCWRAACDGQGDSGAGGISEARRRGEGPAEMLSCRAFFSLKERRVRVGWRHSPRLLKAGASARMDGADCDRTEAE